MKYLFSVVIFLHGVIHLLGFVKGFQWAPVEALTADYSARAIMTWNGITGSGIFYFDKDYNFKKFEALRYMGNKEDAPKFPWIIMVDDYAVFDGKKVPSRMQATWQLDEGDWTWLKLEIEDLRYNIDES